MGWWVVQKYISNLEEHPVIENFEFPVIRVLQHYQPQHFISGKDQILAFLQRVDLLNYELIDRHSSFVVQGKEFVVSEIEPIIQEIFEHPILAWQSGYYLDIDEFKTHVSAVKQVKTIRITLWVAFRAWLKAIMISTKNNFNRNKYKFWKKGI